MALGIFSDRFGLSAEPLDGFDKIIPFPSTKIRLAAGSKKSGGGFIGGGFGVGAVAGMAAATLLNALTAQSSVWVNATIQADDGGFVSFVLLDKSLADVSEMFREAREGGLASTAPQYGNRRLH